MEFLGPRNLVPDIQVEYPETVKAGVYINIDSGTLFLLLFR